MGIKRYVAEKDATITNAYRVVGNSRAVNANMGASDSLEVFNLSGQYSTSSIEASRILIKYPIDSIVADRLNNDLEASGSVSFWLKLSNVEHPFTLPRNFELVVQPISSSWNEGIGLDMEEYSDIDAVNWLSSSENNLWGTNGGDFLTNPNYSCSFATGDENLEIDITDLVEKWISNEITNEGIVVRLPEEIESGSLSHYTKKFSARGSQYFFKRPYIEARWDNSRKDMRQNFFASSSAYSAEENMNEIYYYHRNRGGTLTDPGSTNLFVNLHTVEGELLTSSIETTRVETGIYKASFALDTSESVLVDRWYMPATGNILLYSGFVRAYEAVEDQRYVISLPDLKSEYSVSETPRIRCFTRRKRWTPEKYVTVNTDPKVDIVENLYYKVVREADEYEVIPYLTSSNATLCSYDASGSYFDFDMSILEEDQMYRFQFMHQFDGKQQDFRRKFKFRVEKE